MKTLPSKLKRLAISLLLLFTGFNEINAQSAPAGDGTSYSPFLITSLDNLLWFSQNNDQWNAHFLQTEDIDASETSQWDAGGWVPIGNDVQRFTGVYDGNGKSISGLTINRPESNRQGFFGETSGATLININLIDVSVIGMDYVGGLVGCAGSGEINNVFVSGAIIGSSSAGLLSGSVSDLDVHRCQSQGMVSGNFQIGGLIGISSSMTLTESFSTANIEGDNDVGGLVGSMFYDSIIENCYATGIISADSDRAGGLLGILEENCTVKNSYSIGQVLNSFESGGLIGYASNIGESSVLAGFWDVETSEQAGSAAGDGLTTAEMNDFQTFISVGWDFTGVGENDIWNIGNGRNNGYPYFNWQYPDDEAPNENFRPVATINSVTEITSASAAVNAEILLIGKPAGDEYGICWSTEPSPDVNNFVINKGGVSQEDVFSVQLTELVNNTNYYIRAFAENELGINYSKDFKILTYDINPQRPDGVGTNEDPYLIENLANLLWMSETPESWDKNFLQVNNINASTTAGWNNGKGWKPIGRVDESFNGNYNGNGFYIDGLTINRPEGDYQGLFGQSLGAVFKNIELTNLNITGGYRVGGLAGRTLNSVIENSFATGSIGGGAYVGGLIGSTSDAYVNGCYSICRVIGDSYVGGLIGICREGLTVNTYSHGTIEGERYIGGLIGQLFEKASLKNSYSKGVVTGDEDTGGLAGSFDDSSVYGCFWDMETSGYTESATGTGKTTEEMRDFQTFISLGWDFKDSGINEIWNIGNGKNDGYPYFDWQFSDDLAPDEDFRPVVNIVSEEDVTSNSALINVEIILTGKPNESQFGICWSIEPNPTVEDSKIEKGAFDNPGDYSVQIQDLINNTNYYFRAYAENEVGINYSNDYIILTHDITPQQPEGLGSIEEPYLIDNLSNLLWLSDNPDSWDKSFLQTNSIDASSTSDWNDGEGWNPVGVQGNPFSGSYDGNGYCINGLTINRPNNDYQGLFGEAVTAEFLNIKLIEVNITGDFWVGGLLGGCFIQSVINNCATTGIVAGAGHVGGLAGMNSGSTISNCYSLCDVYGGTATGGLVGSNLIQEVLNSYSLGNVEGDYFVGGLIGQMYANAIATNCFSTGKVTGNSFTGGLVGRIDNSSIFGCFWDIDSSSQTGSAGGESKTTQEMKSLSTFVNAGWEMKTAESSGVWSIDPLYNDGYPYLTDLLPDFLSTCFPEYVLSFEVERFSSNPISDAIIYIAGEELVTNDLGEASIRLIDGNYGYVVRAVGFEEKSGNLSIAGHNFNETVVMSSVATSIKDNDTKLITVFPVPAKEEINVESDKIIEFIRMSTIDGRLVYQSVVDQLHYSFLIGDFNPGVYIIQIKIADDIIMRRIVVE